MLAFATKKPSTGENHDGQREDAASPFIRTALIELSLVDSEVTEAAAVTVTVAGHHQQRVECIYMRNMPLHRLMHIRHVFLHVFCMFLTVY